MDLVTILAQTVETATQTPQAQPAVIPLDWIWGHVTSLNLLEALTFISFGSVCLLYGWRVFRILVVISFAILGLVAGVIVSDRILGQENQVTGGIIGLIAAAALSVPLMRWAVSVLGAVAGGILTSGLWYAFGLDQQYILAGAIIGIVAGGMISFIVFKIAVMLFSSLGGGGLIVIGILALLYRYPDTTEQVQELVYNQRWFLPVALMVPTLVGIILQNKFIKGSQHWDI